MRKLLPLIIVGLVCAPTYATIYATIGSPEGEVTLTSDEVGDLIENPDGTLTWTGSYQHVDYGWGLDWDFNVDGDPSISGVAGFTNLLAVPANFSFDISANSDVTIISPSVNGASVITVLDTNSNGATMDAIAGDSVYDAFIMATSEHKSFVDPFGLIAPVNSIDFDNETWGPQPANSAAINVGDLFGLDHDFRLSAGDQATLNSSFFITPEPTTVLMLLAGAGLALRRRK